MIEADWDSYLDEYKIKYPFGEELKAVRIREDEVNDELLSECVGKHIVSEVSKGYYITHDDIEQHLEVINEYGVEAYLEKRLELIDDE